MSMLDADPCTCSELSSDLEDLDMPQFGDAVPNVIAAAVEGSPPRNARAEGEQEEVEGKPSTPTEMEQEEAIEGLEEANEQMRDADNLSRVDEAKADAKE